MIAVPFTPDRADEWDALVAAAPMGTFLHTRRFLSYHGDRFADASLVITDERDSALALLPAAVDPADPRRVVSHPGATYGGLVHAGGLNGERAVEALRVACRHYAEQGHSGLGYKPVPHIYHRSPSQDDVWALTELGAVPAGRDLSCAVDLAAPRPRSARRERSLAKARRAGVQVSADPGALAAFWPLLEATLERRHSARPVHTAEEIAQLRERFPEAIRPVVGLLDGDVAAGAVLFCTPTVVHTQYLATSEAGGATGALDAVIDHAIACARETGARYFDFGISPGPDRRGLSAGLYRWKAEFGGGGVLYERYQLLT